MTLQRWIRLYSPAQSVVPETIPLPAKRTITNGWKLRSFAARATVTLFTDRQSKKGSSVWVSWLRELAGCGAFNHTPGNDFTFWRVQNVKHNTVLPQCKFGSEESQLAKEERADKVYNHGCNDCDLSNYFLCGSWLGNLIGSKMGFIFIEYWFTLLVWIYCFFIWYT